MAQPGGEGFEEVLRQAEGLADDINEARKSVQAVTTEAKRTGARVTLPQPGVPRLEPKRAVPQEVAQYEGLTKAIETNERALRRLNELRKSAEPLRAKNIRDLNLEERATLKRTEAEIRRAQAAQQASRQQVNVQRQIVGQQVGGTEEFNEAEVKRVVGSIRSFVKQSIIEEVQAVREGEIEKTKARQQAAGAQETLARRTEQVARALRVIQTDSGRFQVHEPVLGERGGVGLAGAALQPEGGLGTARTKTFKSEESARRELGLIADQIAADEKRTARVLDLARQREEAQKAETVVAETEAQRQARATAPRLPPGPAASQQAAEERRAAQEAAWNEEMERFVAREKSETAVAQQEAARRAAITEQEVEQRRLSYEGLARVLGQRVGQLQAQAPQAPPAPPPPVGAPARVARGTAGVLEEARQAAKGLEDEYTQAVREQKRLSQAQRGLLRDIAENQGTQLASATTRGFDVDPRRRQTAEALQRRGLIEMQGHLATATSEGLGAHDPRLVQGDIINQQTYIRGLEEQVAAEQEAARAVEQRRSGMEGLARVLAGRREQLVDLGRAAEDAARQVEQITLPENAAARTRQLKAELRDIGEFTARSTSTGGTTVFGKDAGLLEQAAQRLEQSGLFVSRSLEQGFISVAQSETKFRGREAAPPPPPPRHRRQLRPRRRPRTKVRAARRSGVRGRMRTSWPGGFSASRRPICAPPPFRQGRTFARR
jgi:hypothetical protein